MKVSFNPDIILCGWLGLEHQLTILLTLSVCWYKEKKKKKNHGDTFDYPYSNLITQYKVR